MRGGAACAGMFQIAGKIKMLSIKVFISRNEPVAKTNLIQKWIIF